VDTAILSSSGTSTPVIESNTITAPNGYGGGIAAGFDADNTATSYYIGQVILERANIKNNKITGGGTNAGSDYEAFGGGVYVSGVGSLVMAEITTTQTAISGDIATAGLGEVSAEVILDSNTVSITAADPSSASPRKRNASGGGLYMRPSMSTLHPVRLVIRDAGAYIDVKNNTAIVGNGHQDIAPLPTDTTFYTAAKGGGICFEAGDPGGIADPTLTVIRTDSGVDIFAGGAPLVGKLTGNRVEAGSKRALAAGGGLYSTLWDGNYPSGISAAATINSGNVGTISGNSAKAGAYYSVASGGGVYIQNLDLAHQFWTVSAGSIRGNWAEAVDIRTSGGAFLGGPRGGGVFIEGTITQPAVISAHLASFEKTTGGVINGRSGAIASGDRNTVRVSGGANPDPDKMGMGSALFYAQTPVSATIPPSYYYDDTLLSATTITTPVAAPPWITWIAP
jgi:hypothetical protein